MQGGLFLSCALFEVVLLLASADSPKETPNSSFESKQNCEIQIEWEWAARGAHKHYHHAVSILCEIFRTRTMHCMIVDCEHPIRLCGILLALLLGPFQAFQCFTL